MNTVINYTLGLIALALGFYLIYRVFRLIFPAQNQPEQMEDFLLEPQQTENPTQLEHPEALNNRLNRLEERLDQFQLEQEANEDQEQREDNQGFNNRLNRLEARFDRFFGRFHDFEDRFQVDVVPLQQQLEELEEYFVTQSNAVDDTLQLNHLDALETAHLLYLVAVRNSGMHRLGQERDLIGRCRNLVKNLNDRLNRGLRRNEAGEGKENGLFNGDIDN